jgi:hypothetical protein
VPPTTCLTSVRSSPCHVAPWKIWAYPPRWRSWWPGRQRIFVYLLGARRAQVTRGSSGAALRQKVGAEAQVTRAGCWSPSDTWRPRSCPELRGQMVASELPSAGRQQPLSWFEACTWGTQSLRYRQQIFGNEGSTNFYKDIDTKHEKFIRVVWLRTCYLENKHQW